MVNIFIKENVKNVMQEKLLILELLNVLIVLLEHIQIKKVLLNVKNVKQELILRQAISNVLIVRQIIILLKEQFHANHAQKVHIHLKAHLHVNNVLLVNIFIKENVKNVMQEKLLILELLNVLIVLLEHFLKIQDHLYVLNVQLEHIQKKELNRVLLVQKAHIHKKVHLHVNNVLLVNIFIRENAKNVMLENILILVPLNVLIVLLEHIQIKDQVFAINV